MNAVVKLQHVNPIASLGTTIIKWPPPKLQVKGSVIRYNWRMKVLLLTRNLRETAQSLHTIYVVADATLLYIVLNWWRHSGNPTWQSWFPWMRGQSSLASYTDVMLSLAWQVIIYNRIQFDTRHVHIYSLRSSLKPCCHPMRLLHGDSRAMRLLSDLSNDPKCTNLLTSVQ